MAIKSKVKTTKARLVNKDIVKIAGYKWHLGQISNQTLMKLKI